MSGDAHVRICESLGVQFPRATRLYLKIDGRMWRAVDAEGEVLDVLVQTKRNKRAALKLMRKLLKKYGFHFVFFTSGSRPRLSYRNCIRWRF